MLNGVIFLQAKRKRNIGKTIRQNLFMYMTWKGGDKEQKKKSSP